MKKNTYLPSKRSKIDSFLVMDVLQQSKLLEENGKKIFHLELGEPLNKTPLVVQKEAKRLINSQIPGYTPSNGIFELRKQISDYYKKIKNIEIDSDQIFITTGSSGAFILSFLACFDPGDKIAIFSPVYPAYRNILKSLNLDVIEIPSDKNNFGKIDITKIKNFKDLDGLVLSNPNNPTGQVFSKDELKFIYNFCEKQKITLISDEIYHGIEYEKKTYSMKIFGPNVLVVNSFSKFFCMPGWRLGWVIVPKNLKGSFLKLSQNLFISSSNIGQYSAIKVFDCLKELELIVNNYKKGRDILIKKLSEIKKIKFFKPFGAFYLYLNIEKTGMVSGEFVKKILHETGVALTPGNDFDKINGDNSVRVSFSNNYKIVDMASDILIEWFEENY